MDGCWLNTMEFFDRCGLEKLICKVGLSLPLTVSSSFFRNDGSLYSPHIVFDMDEPALPTSASESRAEKTRVAHLEWLLNVVIDDMVTKAGNQNLPVIQWLTENGFTEHDMTCTLGFPLSEVRAVLAADMGDQ